MARKAKTKTSRKIETLAPSLFYKLPPELCEYIFSFACLDDGYTGRSLSLVSKYISEASKPVKFQSLVLRSLPQAVAVASMLEKAAPYHRRVCHLFVSSNYAQMYKAALVYDDRKAKNGNTKGSATKNGPATSSRFRRIISKLSHSRRHARLHNSNQTNWDPVLKASVRHGNSFSPTIEEMMREALIRILNVVAQSLQILVISIQTPKADVSLSGSPYLPRLRELTVTYGCDYYPRVPTRILDSFQPLPALRRLNLVRFECGHGPLDLVKQIQRLTPCLTHIRLPCAVTGWNRWLDTDFNLCPTPTSERLRLQLPSTVEKIYIQPPLPPQVPGPTQTYYEETLEECRVLAMRDDQVILVKPDSIAWKLDAKDTEREWLDRINGGDGCWNHDNVMVL